MTKQHPLTDGFISTQNWEFCDDCGVNKHPILYDEDRRMLVVEPEILHNALRAAYDQGRDARLEQVIEWLRNNLRFGGYLTPVKYTDEDEIDVDEVVEDLQKAMRPTQEGN